MRQFSRGMEIWGKAFWMMLELLGFGLVVAGATDCIFINAKSVLCQRLNNHVTIVRAI